jgi:Zn-dependent protease
MHGIDLTPIGILTIILQVLIILFSLSIHESAHAWMADRLGDSTARMLGRITLNPIPHIDVLGTIILPLILAFAGGPIFGWAKPVPVVNRNFKNLRRDEALVGAAGPLSNMLLCILATMAMAIMMAVMGPAVFFTQLQGGYSAPWWLYQLAFLNLILAVFNLIPIPPLDGSWILSAILPYKVHRFYEEIRRWGPILLLVLFFTPALDIILTPLLKVFSFVFITLPLGIVQSVLLG